MSSEDTELWQAIKYNGQIVEVQARPGNSQSHGQPFVLLHDIQDIFPGASRLMCGKRALGFMVDAQGNRLHPLRVPYLTDITMEVIVSDDPNSGRTPINTSPQSSVIRSPSTTSNSTDDERSPRSPRPSRTPRQPTVSPRPSRSRLQQQAAEKQLVEQAQQQQLIEQARQMRLSSQKSSSSLTSAKQELESLPHIKPPPIPETEVPAEVIPRKPRQGSNISLSSEKFQTQYRKSVVLYHSFLQHIKAGQTEQANVVKEDFRIHFGNLEIEMAKNQELQAQMLEMQQTMLAMQQNALDRLALIQDRVQAILLQSYELHEYPIPRLFVILPKDPSRWDGNNLMRNRFKLYFMCECGEHTKVAHQSKIPHNIHLVKHEGYDIERPTEFFRRYGHYILKLLQMLKYGVRIGGLAVPAITPTRPGGNGFLEEIAGPRDNNPTFDNYNVSNLEAGVNKSIEYLNGMFSEEADSPTGMRHPDDTVEALEGSELRRLSAFLKKKDEDDVFGNLFRIVTNEGHVKWVCQEHYRETYNTMPKRELEELTSVNDGFFDEHHGRVHISLSTPTTAAQFYKTLERTRFVQELQIKLKWEITFQDAKNLRDAVQRSNISVLELTCTPSNSPGELLNRNKRAEPLWQIVSNPKIRSFSLAGYTGFFRRCTIEARPNELRYFKVTEAVDWKRDQAKVVELLQTSPHLTDISVGCTHLIEMYKGIREAAAKRCDLTRLTLEAGVDERLSAQFEQDQALVGLDLVIPSLSLYGNLLKAADCISTLHICTRTIGSYSDCTPITDLIGRNRNMTELKIACYVSEFNNLYEAIRTSVLANRSSRLKKVCLYRGENQLFTPDIRTPQLVSLELLHMKVHDNALLTLLHAHGSKLTKLRIDTEHWKPIHSAALREATRSASTGSRLTHLYLTCADVDEGILRELSMVINRSNLLDYTLVVDQAFGINPSRSDYWVDFINCIGDKLTSLVVCCPEPNDWIEALGSANFPAMERISFNRPTTPEKEGNPGQSANKAGAWM
ncbi:hypothetical protein B0O80DRAFT_424670 [Mortierella sp. GBAus27b]|nr:hypothetical protein BGX31_007366 [Mortierella sp. GBA43]KAI8357679.1 hypothetical protein B0O80DRAFT_424670 [Mortierella sp. GBAus27b]